MALLASHTLPCLGRTFFLTEGTRQLSRASFSPFPFYQCLPCVQQPQLITILHLPPVPTEPFSLPTSPLLLLCLYSLQTLCRKSPVVHLCAHNCSAHAIPRSHVSQQLSPSSRSCFPTHLFHESLWILHGVV